VHPGASLFITTVAPRKYTTQKLIALVNFNVENARLSLSTSRVPQVVPVVKKATVIITAVVERRNMTGKAERVR
jgi:hypothetical protein